MLTGPDRKLFRGVVGVWIDAVVEEWRSGESLEDTLPAFDGLPPASRVDAIRTLAAWKLAGAPEPPRSLPIEAAMVALGRELATMLRLERADAESRRPGGSWRADVDAVLFPGRYRPDDPDRADRTDADRIIARWFGPVRFPDGENYADGDPADARRFIRASGLPTNYFRQVPPEPSIDATQLSIDQMQAWVFDDSLG